MKVAISWVLMMTALAACGRGTNRVEEAKQKNEIPEIIQKSYESCVGENCVTVDIAFPRYAGNSPAYTSINEAVEEFLTASLTWGEETTPFENYEAAIADFMASFETVERDGYNSVDWMIEFDGKEVFRSGDLITLKFTMFSFTGGAHPNSSYSFVTFDLAQGGIKLKNDALILDKEALLDRAIAAFRIHHDVADGVSLEDDGRFFLDNGSFFLPQAMGYSEGDFVLLYNPYEIGPYVMGITELSIPISKLEGVVRQPLSP
ncbi:DUF3298 and DUF4163 domain-containing protein [Lunatimonas salinarum]|uniref:DUF3298 and DUF4163 domain-containing protein n=1 Tax=Lunatimonas salinarum TaxID=1774590 RepID=UPI001AE071A5|nr:DUF3298 and DUF4163 domain-containing protein [Lunatimonas salinarum]